MNREFLRCIELLEKERKINHTLRFKLIAGRAFLNAKNTQAAISLLEGQGEEGDPSMHAEKYQLLAEAYESMEDKNYTVMYLKLALQ